MANNQMKFGIGLDFNVNKASLDNVRKTLKQLRDMSAQEIQQSGGNIAPMSDMAMKSWKNNLGAMRKELDALEKAFEQAYNPKLGTYELNKFNQSLKDSGTSVQRAFQAVSAYGAQGEAALLNMTTNMMAVDRAAKQVHGTFEKLANTMMNTIRWSITSSAINMVTGSIQQAYYYALDLDKSLNDIMIVTDKSSAQMEDFARQANKAAKALGASTTDYTEASLIYYQQGLSDKDVASRTDVTLKTAAVTGQSAQQISEQLTAVWNGYKVSADEAELYIDKLAAVAATTAADLEELSTGMSKVASAANIMGVDTDQLNAQLATIVSVTREAPEAVGTALKTVYARMSDIEAGLDTETTLGEYTSQMAAMGINVLDTNGKLRDMGEVVEEIGGKWSSLNREQQVSLAQSIAGTRQYSRMMALFDNWDMYQDAMTTSLNAAGTLSRQHAKYLESIEAHQNKLKASAEGLYDSIFDSDEIKVVYDTLSGIVTLVDELVQAMGGMPGLLAAAGTFFTRFARNSISELITKQQINKLNKEIYSSQIKENLNTIESLKDVAEGSDLYNKAMQETLDLEKKLNENANNFSDEQWKVMQDGVKEYSRLMEEAIKLEGQAQTAQKQVDYLTTPQTFTVGEEEKRVQLGNKTDRDELKKAIAQSEQNIDKKIKNKKKEIKEAEKKVNKNNSPNKEEEEQLKRLRKEYEELLVAKRKNDEANKSAKKALEIVGDGTKSVEELKQEIEKCSNASKEFADRAGKVKDNVDKSFDGIGIADKITDATDAIMSGISAATAFSSGIKNVISDIDNGTVSVDTFIDSLSSLAMGAIPLLTKILPAFKGVGGGIKGVFKEIKMSAELTWASVTLGISVILPMITAVIDALDLTGKRAAENRKEILEDAKAKKEETEANIQLIDSYETLYDKYKESGEVTEDLTKAAEELIEKYNIENGEILLLTENYEELTKAIKEKRKAEIETERAAARNALAAAQGQLTENIKGVTDVQNAAGGYNITFYKSTYDSKNYALLEEAVQSVGGELQSNGNKLTIITPSESSFALFYNKLSEAYSKMEDKQNSNIAKNVKQMLDDESYSSGALSYLENQQTLAKLTAEEEIAKYDYSKGTISQFNQDRTALINKIKAENKLNDDQAEAIVDAEYASIGGNAYELLKRKEWIDLYAKKGLDTAGWDAKIDLANVSKADFAAIMSLDIKDYANDIDKLIEAGKKKAKEIQKELWLSKSEERLHRLEKDYEQASRDEDKSVGAERLKAIDAQSYILQKQIDLLKQVSEESREAYQSAAQDFANLAGEHGVYEGELKNAIESGDWEYAQDLIEGLGQPDISGELLSSLIELQAAGNDYLDKLDEINEKEDEVQEARVKRFEETLDIMSEAAEAQKEYESFKRDFLLRDDDFSSIGRSYLSDFVIYDDGRIGANTTSDFVTNKELVEDMQDAFENLELIKGTYDPADYDELFKNIISTVKDGLSGMKEAIEQYEQARLSALDAISDAYAKQLSYLEDTSMMLEHHKELTELIYGDEAQGQLKGYYDQALANAKSIEEVNKNSYEYWKQQYENAIREKVLPQEEIDKLYEKMNESAKQWAQSIADTLQIEQEKYLNSLATAISDFDKKLTGGKGIESIREQYEWMKKSNEDYLTSLDAAFGVEKARATFEKAIKDSNNPKTQQLINNLMEDELSTLEKMDKLSQYDLDRANKKLEILQAQIALQDAQDAKTKMRLTRGPDGTYSYQYVADDLAITEAEDKLNQASQELYQLDYEKYQEDLDNFYDLYTEYLDKMEQAWADGELTGDEAKLLRGYEDRLSEIAKESERHQKNLRLSIEDSAKVLGIETSEAMTSVEELFNTGLANVVTSFSTGSDGVQKSFTELREYIEGEAEKFTTAAETQQDTLMKLLYGEDGKSGTIGAYKDLAEKQDITIQKYQTEKTELDKLLGSYGIAKETFSDTATEIQDMADAWKNYATERRKAAIAAGYTVNENEDGSYSYSGQALNLGDVKPEIEATGDVDVITDTGNIDSEYRIAGGKLKEIPKTQNTWSLSPNVFSTGLSIEVGSTMYDENGNLVTATDEGGNYRQLHLHGSDYDGQYFADEAGNAYVAVHPWGNEGYYWYVRADQLTLRSIYNKPTKQKRFSDVPTFDTGGYTGSWNSSEGRMAMLHEKEIVLNEQDTVNLLKTVNIVRSLESSLFNRLDQIDLVKSFSEKFHGSLDDSIIEQTVYINASFPGVSVKEEIEEAFNDLINMAIQHVHEKK